MNKYTYYKGTTPSLHVYRMKGNVFEYVNEDQGQNTRWVPSILCSMPHGFNSLEFLLRSTVKITRSEARKLFPQAF